MNNKPLEHIINQTMMRVNFQNHFQQASSFHSKSNGGIILMIMLNKMEDPVKKLFQMILIEHT